MRFLEVVKTNPLGAKLPFVGMITTADLLNYAKLIGMLLPAAVSYSLVALHYKDQK